MVEIVENLPDPSTWTPEDPRGLGRPLTREDMEIASKIGYVIPEFRDSKVTVELLLDFVDLKLDWYIPSIESLNFMNFIRLCVGEEPQNLNSKAHYFFIDCMFHSEEVKPYFMCRNIDYDALEGNTLILSSREFSKSTLIVYLILYMASDGRMPGFGKVNFGMYVSDKMEKGNVVTTMNTVEALCKQSAYLMSQFEHTHFTDAQATFIRKPKTEAEVKIYNKHINSGGKLDTVPHRMKRQFKIQGLGSSGGRGSRDILDRPEFAIYDDMIGNEKDAYSQAYLDNIESTIESDVGSSLSGDGHFQILIGTAYHTADPVYSRVEEGTWMPVVFPKAEEPPHGDIFDKDGVLVKPAMTKERFVSVWDDRHSFEKQRAKYATAEIAKKNGKPKKLKSIDQEFYVRVTSEHERLVPTANIVWRNLSHIKKNARDYRWYLTTDYTTTGNASSDDSGAFLFAVDWDENWYLMDMKLEKMELNRQYQNTLDMIALAKKWGAYTVEVGVEIDGQQVLHITGLDSYAAKQGEYISYAKQKIPGGKSAKHIGIRSKGHGDKLWRLKLVVPKFDELQVIFNEDLKQFHSGMVTFLNELKMTTYTEIKSTDNGLDCRVAGTQICLSDGNSVSIEDLREGDFVLTVGGQHGVSHGTLAKGKVSNAIMTGVKEVSDYLLSNGDIVSCTDNELFMTTEGYVFACDLTENHIVLGHKLWRNTNINGESKMDTTSQPHASKEKEDTYINMSTGSTLEYGVVETWLSTIMTKIRQTMSLRTLDSLPENNTERFIKTISRTGLRAKKAFSGTKNIIGKQKNIPLNLSRRKSVNVVGKNTQQQDMTERHVQESALQSYTNQHTLENQQKNVKYAKKNSLDYVEQKPALVSVQAKSESRTRRFICLLVNTVMKYLNLRSPRQQPVLQSAMIDKSSISQSHGYVKQTDAVITSISSMQKEGRSTVQKNVNLSIDEQVVELVKNNLNEFNKIRLVKISNRRLEKTYGFEVYGTNNYLSGSGVVMHNCQSQMALIDIYYPPEPVNIKDESGYNIQKVDSIYGDNWSQSGEETSSGFGRYISR